MCVCQGFAKKAISQCLGLDRELNWLKIFGKPSSSLLDGSYLLIDIPGVARTVLQTDLLVTSILAP